MRKNALSGSAILCLIIISLVSCATPPPPQPTPNAKVIVQGISTPGMPSVPTSPAPGQNPPPTVPASYGVLSPEEQSFLVNYLSRLSYMVYYNDASGVDPRFAKMAVAQANRYLIEKMGLSVIDFDQIERNKKDQLEAYQAETGGSIDMIQYLAQKYNADVYVEIDIKASGSGIPGSWNGSAQGTMKLFETSTAILLGSIAFTSPPTFSPVSQDSAVANAIAASVWQAMPKMTEQSKALLAASLSRGVRYELVAQKIPDAKMVSQFIKALSRKFREVEQLSFSPGETRIALFVFTAKAKVQEAIYDAAATVLMPDMYLVYMRGKSFTFNSGL
ncbi:MAG: hypothetical protein NT061_07410 [Spirochaetes bacterium]|nr:hypothetical protein [Spirochaetota bacterium]